MSKLIQDASEIEVLFAGDLADDDRIWVVRCSVEELHRMFVNPVAWVAALADLPGWVSLGTGEKAPAVTLTDDFAMVAEWTERQDPDGWVMVQGIDATNALTLVADREAALLSAKLEAGGSFEDFWKRVAADPDNAPSGKKPFPVVVLEDQARWYGHFEIRDAVMEPLALARRVSTFLLATLYDPAGYVAMLNGLDQKPRFIKDRTEHRDGTLEIAVAKTPAKATFYANVLLKTEGEMVLRDGDGDDPTLPDPFACTTIGGATIGGTGTNDGGTIKRYGVEDPPPTPPRP